MTNINGRLDHRARTEAPRQANTEVAAVVDVDDAELLTSARAGEGTAVAELFARHRPAAIRTARAVAPASDVEDIVAEAFTNVLGQLSRGGGPTDSFRAYLMTAIRHEASRQRRTRQRSYVTEDIAVFDRPLEMNRGGADLFERGAVQAAFVSLPKRWQLVLWQIEVDGRTPREIGSALGMRANSVSALAYRARAALRDAYLDQHVRNLDDVTALACRTTRPLLAASVRGRLSARDRSRVAHHVDSCAACALVIEELTEVNRHVGVLATPVAVFAVAGMLSAAALPAAGKVGWTLKALIPTSVPLVPAAGAVMSAAILAGIPAIHGPVAPVSPETSTGLSERPERAVVEPGPAPLIELTAAPVSAAPPRAIPSSRSTTVASAPPVGLAGEAPQVGDREAGREEYVVTEVSPVERTETQVSSRAIHERDEATGVDLVREEIWVITTSYSYTAVSDDPATFSTRCGVPDVPGNSVVITETTSVSRKFAADADPSRPGSAHREVVLDTERSKSAKLTNPPSICAEDLDTTSAPDTPDGDAGPGDTTVTDSGDAAADDSPEPSATPAP